MKQLGPKQFSFIKDYAEQLKKSSEVDKNKPIEEAPELVAGDLDFEAVAAQN